MCLSVIIFLTSHQKSNLEFPFSMFELFSIELECVSLLYGKYRFSSSIERDYNSTVDLDRVANCGGGGGRVTTVFHHQMKMAERESVCESALHSKEH